MGQEPRRLSDEYEISGVLGRGGFSVVRKGKRKISSPEQFVAIKTLRRIGPHDATAASTRKKSEPSAGLHMAKQASISDALLTNEILVMRRIVESVSPHENVVDLYDVFEDRNGAVHLVLELCSGGELFDRIVAEKRCVNLATIRN